jgi:hypothetical protein
MSESRGLDRAMLVVLGLLALVFAPKPFLAETPLYSELLTERVLLVSAAPIKVVFLALAARWAYASAAALEKGNPARRPWAAMAVALAAFFVGQSILAVYQVGLNIPTPFPSPADPFFVCGMAAMLVALALFARAYRRAGLALGSLREIVMTAALATAVLAALGSVSLAPIVATPAPAGVRALNVTYPVLDFLLLVPTIVLARMAVRLRGGAIWLVWSRLLTGFALMAVADILFAYFTTVGFTSLDSLLDLFFAWSYVFMAWGAAAQVQVLRS